MEAVQNQRPTAITIIGWVSIVGGALMGLSGLMGLLAYSAMQQMSGGKQPVIPDNLSPSFKMAGWMFQHFELLSYSQVGIAFLVMVAGVYFLKLREWARMILEIMSWLGLIYTIGFAMLWIPSWIAMTTGSQAQAPAAFGIVGAIMGILVLAVFAVPLVLMIKYLRGPVVREAVQRAGLPPPSQS